MKAPSLSVIIPCYNQGKYMEDILSCFPEYWNQNLYELIFVNDGSTDAYTLSKLKQMENDGYQIFHQENQGVCVARNNGIMLSKGRYILPLDGDDMISIDFIYEAISILDTNPLYSVVYCDGEFFGIDKGRFTLGEFNLQRLMCWNFLYTSSVFRRTMWEKVGGYDINISGMEDWDLWLSIAFVGGRFYYLPKPFFSYRILPNSTFRSLTAFDRNHLLTLIEGKHSEYMNRNYLNEVLISKLKVKKQTWLKLFLRVFFPEYLHTLVKKGKVETINII